MRSYLFAAFAFFVAAGCSKPAAVSGDLVFIEGGSFVMGNRYDTADPDESFLHKVRLGSYYFGRHEVTVGQFREFAEKTGYVTTAERLGNASVFIGKKVAKPGDGSWKNPYFRQHDRHPVVCVSWWDAIAYCNWRSAEEGLDPCYEVGADSTVIWNREADGYRLATEAEWEYAGRSRGMDMKYVWGDSIPMTDGKPAGNTRDEAAHRQWGISNYWEGYDDGYAWTAPVDTFAPNICGIYGISGNVYEWCWDWYSDWYERSPSDDPAGPPSGEMRACRDAGFGCSIYQEVVSSRGKGFPYLAFSWGGFRVARSIPK
ncbi:MAG: SUMF1/EgtB/PvdO family nonheme iron enzyme [Candidatus Krumholzibacteriota bacterium]|nr:SUMF1/EgtB/PvdO family nonheme iron enzyme [Candidatus Krumholzibacteriota bacterium]